MAKIDKAIGYLIDFADDDSKGYSQVRRRIARTVAEAQEISEGDCSSTTLNALIFADYDIGDATYTGDVVSNLLKAGWKNVTSKVNLRTGAGLKAGYIVVRPRTEEMHGHMAMMISATQLVQCQYDYDGKPGDSSGREIRRQNYYNSPFAIALAPPDEIPSRTVIEYQTHIEDMGWTKVVADGEMSGTVGKSLRVEAIRIHSLGIRYRSHVQDFGWQNFVSSDELSGTIALSKRLEAIEILLDNPNFDVLYQVHVQDMGWQAWKKNGETAGTVGKSLRIEAIRIKVERK